MLFRTPADSLLSGRADFSREHTYPVEDRITRQENAFRKVIPDSVQVSAPRKYRKLTHLMHFHSWAPVFFDFDDVSSLSLDYIYGSVAPGLTGYFQNTLGTMSGMIGFAVAPDPDARQTWRPAVHAKFKYTGLYPVIEGNFDFGHTTADLMVKAKITEGEDITYGLVSGSPDNLLVRGTLRTYVPLGFAKGGISYGFVPQASYSISNSRFDTAMRELAITGRDPETDEITEYEWGPGHVPAYTPMQRLSVSARGYVMRPRAHSQVYPRWGVGLEAGFSMRPGMTRTFLPNAYVYTYGYLPGIWRTQGLRFVGMFQHRLQFTDELPQVGELAVNTLPEGFPSAAQAFVGQNYPWQLNLSAKYAIPVFVGDISLPPILYIRNFLVIPDFDFTLLPGRDNLWSVGADITAEMGKFFLPFDCSLGVSVSYLSGNAYETIGLADKDRWAFRMIMSYDF